MILCTGEAVIDMIRTQINGQEAFLPIPGGCAYNTSIAIGRLGIPVAFFGRISTNFFGDIQVQRLKENNVDTGLLLRCEQNPILAFIKIEEGKDPQYAFYEEGTVDRLLSPQEIPALSDDINCIVFGSVSMAMEPIGSTIEEFILKESKLHLKNSNRRFQPKMPLRDPAGAGRLPPVIAFDPNIRPVMIHDRDAYLRRFEKLAGASTIVKISLEDFDYFQPNPQPDEALEKINAMGARLAIITLGPNGAIAMLKREDGSTIKVSAPGVPISKVADTVGAGDSFMGALLTRLETKGKLSNSAIAALSEADLCDALEFANKAAAFVCTQHGCEPPFSEQVI